LQPVHITTMLVRAGMPKTLLWVINLIIIYVTIFTLYRLVMFIVFKPEEIGFNNIVSSFLLGLRFDLRWISFFLLPIVLAGHFETISPFYSEKTKKWWTWYLAVVTFFVVFFFAADFNCFSYNRTRLAASALNFAEDPVTSAKMVWESYPIIWMIGGLILTVICLRWVFSKSHIRVNVGAAAFSHPHKKHWFIVAALGLALMAYGTFSSQPLKWKQAFESGNSFVADLALNPLQNFFTTLKMRKAVNNDDAARASFPVMKNMMQIPGEDLSFVRQVPAINAAVKTRPNVILVMCESFSMYKSSMSGNPLNTTPYFNTLTQNGVFYERCFTPHFSTARGLFSTITGIPDVQLAKFSTRNPEALNQHTIINDFKGYNKYYFLGGDPGFSNFSGLLNNIEGLQMVTEGQFASKPVNVWGISDKDLFLEANQRFAKETAPFFAIVQTADNHRPFEIPKGEKEFKKKTVSQDTLKKYGFESLDEFNSFRYADFSFEKFMEAAKKEAYFNNTIFVFIGDHGVTGNATAVYGDVWTKTRLTEYHVPLLFYAPGLLAAERRTDVVSQIDVLPTIASIAGIPYRNTTLGRDVFNKRNGNNFAFTIHHDGFRVGLVTDKFYFTKNLLIKQEEIHWLADSSYTKTQKDSIRSSMSTAASAYYETAKWMLLNNKRSNSQGFNFAGQ
jgi:phosphoglycerol transferase MdoB-like AlkP superfamily enzyme